MLTIIWITWAAWLVLYLFGINPMTALAAGASRVKDVLPSAEKKAAAVETTRQALEEAEQAAERDRLNAAKDLAHKIRQAELDAGMKKADPDFVLSTCDDKDCTTCFPIVGLDATVYGDLEAKNDRTGSDCLTTP